MTRGFGPGSPSADDGTVTVGQENIKAGPTADGIAGEFATDRGFTFPLPSPEDLELRERIVRLVAEGIQELEHASLVRAQMHNGDGQPRLRGDSTRTSRVGARRGPEHPRRGRRLAPARSVGIERCELDPVVTSERPVKANG
jgi:hypothetical protein